MTSGDVDIERAVKSPYASIVADVVGHPSAISIDDLEGLNPEYDESFLRSLVDGLEKDGVLHREGEKVILTDEAREVFAERGVFDEDAYQRQYERVERDETCPECDCPFTDYLEPGDRYEGTSRGTMRVCVSSEGAYFHSHPQVMDDPSRESPFDE